MQFERHLPSETGKHAPRGLQRTLPESLFQLFTDLIDAEIAESTARDLIELGNYKATNRATSMPRRLHVARVLENALRRGGTNSGARRPAALVALVGPTGVGKTTTIAKLAGNFA